MTLLKWCLCLSFLVVVLSKDLPERSQGFQITDVKLLSPLPGLSEILKKLYKVDDKERVAVLNEYVDDILIHLNEFIRKINLDPIPLPSFEERFQWAIFIGWVSLDDGWLRGLSTIERQDDVIIKYNYPNIKLHMALGFKKLSFDYHYEAKFMGLGPEGLADGYSKGSEFTVDLDLNMVNLRANLDKFKLNTVGKLSLKFDGSVVSCIANMLISIVLSLLKPVLTVVLDGFIRDGLIAMLGAYNNVICKVLADCPEQIANTVFQQLH